MIKLIRELVVLPLRLLVLVCRIVPVFDQYALVKWIWKIGRAVEDGCTLISMIGQKEGLEAAQVLAGQILTETRSARVAVVIGIMESQNNPDFISIKGWIDRAEELDCDDGQLLLILKFVCSMHFPEYNNKQIVDEMIACKYLPMEYSRAALVEKADILCSEKRWEEAELIADHLLCVKEDSHARIFKWIVSLQRADHGQAEIHFAKSKGNIPEHYHSALVGQGYLYLGRDDEAMGWLYEAVKGGLRWPMQKESPVGRMLQSDKFAAYCAGRN
ncbi:MAG: hypothetical protein FVQ79_03775 [Planctomycetes bacterium]|nr:hypothetical protein [Planctomycetota bacterium]